ADFRRGQAEDLINFMVGDLRAKLAPVGRLEILDDVGRKAIEYFQSIPREKMSADELYRRSQAMSQIGEVRRAQGNQKAAMDAYRESVALAEDAVRQDPQKDDWKVGLGAAYFYVGDILRLSGDLD